MDNKNSLFYPQHFKITNNKIKIPKIGELKFVKHRAIEGRPLFVTLTQDGEHWFISITCKLEMKDSIKVEIDKANIIGIDVGSTHFAKFSDNTIIDNPKFLKKYEKKLKRAQQALSRKSFIEKQINDKLIKTSSNNRIKQKIKVQNIYRKVKNSRNDFLHKLTKHIITKYDGVSLETLDIKQMLKENKTNHKKVFNRSISDCSWFEFSRQLEYKSKWNGKYYFKVDKYFPSSQICSNCNNVMKIELDIRQYKCSKCNIEIDRDINAAINIRNIGIQKFREKSTVGTTGI